MKRILCFALLLVTVASLLALPAGARVIQGGVALDKVAILEDYNKAAISGNFTDEEKKEIAEAFGLAEHYKIEYTIDTETNTIDIYCGTDENGNIVKQNMLPYAQKDWVPWHNDYEQSVNIQNVVLRDGVGSLGRYTFWGCDRLETVWLPHSVKKIDRTALWQCKNLETVYYQGNREDFLANVKFDQVRNWYENDKGEIVFNVMDKIHFGESVTVECVNQEGEVFRTYTVGGYFAGDEYVITPETLNGMSYVGSKTEIKDTFDEGDDTVYTLEYRCDHQYIVTDPTKPCGSRCKYCGRANPEVEELHEWGEPQVKSERGFLTPLDQTVKCEVCGLERSAYKNPLILPIGITVIAVLAVGFTAFLIIFITRRKKRLKDLTW